MTSTLRLATASLSLAVAAVAIASSGSEGPQHVASAAPSNTSAPSAVNPCAEEMKLVQGQFCVDAFEASTVEVGPSGAAQPHSPFLPVKGLRVRAVSQPHVVPQAYISRNEANLACREAGKRLCTDGEWIAACKGPGLTRYPYGNERQQGSCVDTGRVSPLDRLFHGAARYVPQAMNDPRLNQIEGTLALTGAFERCTNDFGVYDMVGNLHEWTADPAGTFRGGFYLDTKINGEGCDYRTVAHEASYHDYSTGFRCCADRTAPPRG